MAKRKRSKKTKRMKVFFTPIIIFLVILLIIFGIFINGNNKSGENNLISTPVLSDTPLPTNTSNFEPERIEPSKIIQSCGKYVCEVPELGIKFNVPQILNDLTFTIDGFNDGSRWAKFYLKSSGCEIGTLSRFKSGSQYSGTAVIKTLNAESIGYSGVQSACSTQDNFNDVQTQGILQFKTIFNSIESIN